MVDPIAIAEQIIGIGLYIKRTIDEVKHFKKHAERMLFRVNQIMPSLQVLANMKSKREELNALQKDESRLLVFAESLEKMLHLVEQVKDFSEELKGMKYMDKIKDNNKIKAKFEDLDWKLGVLQDSILFGVLTEVKKEVEAAEPISNKEESNNREADGTESTRKEPDKAEKSLQSLVRHVKLVKSFSISNDENPAEVDELGKKTAGQKTNWDSIKEDDEGIESKKSQTDEVDTIDGGSEKIETSETAIPAAATSDQVNQSEGKTYRAIFLNILLS